MTKKIVGVLCFLSLIMCVNCKKKNVDKSDVSEDSLRKFEIIKIYVHDINSFTEGFFYKNGVYYESTGAPAELPQTNSLYGVLDLKTGKIEAKSILDKKIFFGEGITACDNKIYQITYKNKIGFIYDLKTHKKIGQFTYENNEGWGLTSINDKSLIMSDGTNILTFINATTFKVEKTLQVQYNGIPINNLNELEYVNGYIFANVYTTNDIVIIDVTTGDVVEKIDMSSLYYDSQNKSSSLLEMNGIAYNPLHDSFYITGKMWPCIYEIKIKKQL